MTDTGTKLTREHIETFKEIAGKQFVFVDKESLQHYSKLDIVFNMTPLQLMRGIKRIFDPNNILNAGKIFDALPSPSELVLQVGKKDKDEA